MCRWKNHWAAGRAGGLNVVDPEPAGTARLVHFVGFRDDRYWAAVRVFGWPDMIHEAWDRYAADDVAPGDVVVFAEGEWDQLPRSFTVEAEQNRRLRDARKPG